MAGVGGVVSFIQRPRAVRQCVVSPGDVVAGGRSGCVAPWAAVATGQEGGRTGRAEVTRKGPFSAHVLGERWPRGPVGRGVLCKLIRVVIVPLAC